MVSVILGKVLSSDSHLLYQVRIFDASEVAAPPQRADYAFGSFVRIDTDAGDGTAEQVVGVIANSRLINPEGFHYGPRLTVPHTQNEIFAPDYINEVGVLVSVLLLGQLHEEHGEQGVPPLVVPVGSEVRALAHDEMLRFHRGPAGRFQLRYYPLLTESGPGLAPSLVQRICRTLHPLCAGPEQRLLAVVQKNMAWQSTLGMMR